MMCSMEGTKGKVEGEKSKKTDQYKLESSEIPHKRERP